MLSDADIYSNITRGHLSVEPLIKGSVQPASVDMHLDSSFIVAKQTHKILNPKDFESEDFFEKVDSDDFILLPGQFILASTIEYVKLDETLAALFLGKSSLARIGLQVECAGLVDPGFEGQITLEVVNFGSAPIKLTAGMSIGQLCVYSLDTPCEIPYGHPSLNSKYQKQTAATASRYNLN